MKTQCFFVSFAVGLLFIYFYCLQPVFDGFTRIIIVGLGSAIPLVGLYQPRDTSCHNPDGRSILFMFQAQCVIFMKPQNNIVCTNSRCIHPLNLDF